MVCEIQVIDRPVDEVIWSSRKIEGGMWYLRRSYAGQRIARDGGDSEYVSAVCRFLYPLVSWLPRTPNLELPI